MPTRSQQHPRSRDLGPIPSATIVARRYQAHPPGFVYVALTVLLVLGAVNSQNNLLFAIFGIAVAGIIVSGIVSGAAIMGLRVEREIVGPAQAGGDARVIYRVRNINWLIPSAGIVIEEVDVDRRGRHRSTWRAHLGPICAFVPWIKAHDEVAVAGSAKALRRGRPTLNLIRLSTTFPFGLTKKYVLFSQPAEMVVRPWVAPIQQQPLAGASGEITRSRRRRPTRSASGEFFSIRDYSPGDSPRAVAWRASARRGHLVVRENADREHRRLLLDVEPHGLAGEDLERFLAAVAGLASTELTTGVDLALRCGDLSLPAAAGPRQRTRILDALALLPTPPAFPPRAPVGRLLIRSHVHESPTILASKDLIALCRDWTGFPPIVEVPKTRRLPFFRSWLRPNAANNSKPTQGDAP